jgi:hypothetical protein
MNLQYDNSANIFNSRINIAEFELNGISLISVCENTVDSSFYASTLRFTCIAVICIYQIVRYSSKPIDCCIDHVSNAKMKAND